MLENMKRNKSLDRPRSKSEYNIKIDLREIRCECGLDWSGLRQSLLVHIFELSNKASGSMTVKKFRHYLCYYVVGSKIFRPDIQKPRQMENAVRDI